MEKIIKLLAGELGQPQNYVNNVVTHSKTLEKQEQNPNQYMERNRSRYNLI